MIFNHGLDTVADLYSKDPAQAASTWLSIETVANGLSSGSGEVLGGLWTLLVSWAALRSGRLPKALNIVGLVVGVIGIISVVPFLHILTGLFGITQIVWFAWLGIVLLRGETGTAA